MYAIRVNEKSLQLLIAIELSMLLCIQYIATSIVWYMLVAQFYLYFKQ